MSASVHHSRHATVTAEGRFDAFRCDIGISKVVDNVALYSWLHKRPGNRQASAKSASFKKGALQQRDTISLEPPRLMAGAECQVLCEVETVDAEPPANKAEETQAGADAPDFWAARQVGRAATRPAPARVGQRRRYRAHARGRRSRDHRGAQVP